MPKPQKTEVRETPPEALTPDPETVSNMRAMSKNILELKAKDELLRQELRAISPKLLDMINRRLGKAFGYLDEALSARASQFGAHAPDDEERALRDRHREMVDTINAICAEVREVEGQLADLVSLYGKARDVALHVAYESLVKRISDAIRPFCESEDDAQIMAEIFPILRGIHERIGIWGGVGAAHRITYSCSRLLNELEQPIPQ